MASYKYRLYTTDGTQTTKLVWNTPASSYNGQAYPSRPIEFFYSNEELIKSGSNGIALELGYMVDNPEDKEGPKLKLTRTLDESK